MDADLVDQESHKSGAKQKCGVTECHDHSKHSAAADMASHCIDLWRDHTNAEADQCPANHQHGQAAHERDSQIADRREQCAEAYDGAPAEALTAERLADVFGAPMDVIRSGEYYHVRLAGPG